MQMKTAAMLTKQTILASATIQELEHCRKNMSGEVGSAPTMMTYFTASNFLPSIITENMAVVKIFS